MALSEANDASSLVAAVLYDDPLLSEGAASLVLTRSVELGASIVLEVNSTTRSTVLLDEDATSRGAPLALMAMDGEGGALAGGWLAFGTRDAERARLRVQQFIASNAGLLAVVRDEVMTRTELGWRLATPEPSDSRANAPLAIGPERLEGVSLTPFCREGHCEDVLLMFGEGARR